MSRVGLMPIPVPQGVTVTIQDCQVTVKGPKGELMREFHPDMSIVREGDVLKVTRPSDQRMHRALHGLTRALLANMVAGVSQGFTKGLEIEGTGYRAELQGKNLIVNVGYSHPVPVIPPAGISFSLDRTGRNLAVEGIDKELVGEVAARIRAIRKPEPYKGKGIRYAGERVRRKAGKAGKVGK